MESFSDLEEDVRQSVARVKASPFVPHKESVRGCAYGVQTGRLREVACLAAEHPGARGARRHTGKLPRDRREEASRVREGDEHPFRSGDGGGGERPRPGSRDDPGAAAGLRGLPGADGSRGGRGYHRLLLGDGRRRTGERGRRFVYGADEHAVELPYEPLAPRPT